MNDTGANVEGGRIEEAGRDNNTDIICQTEKSQVSQLSLKSFSCCYDIMVACRPKENKTKDKVKNQQKKPTFKDFFLKVQAILEKNPHNEVPSNSECEPSTNFLENYAQQALQTCP